MYVFDVRFISIDCIFWVGLDSLVEQEIILGGMLFFSP